MRRILSLACGLALAAPAVAQERAPQPPARGAEGGRDVQAEIERLRAQLRELEARLNQPKGGDRRPDAPKGPPDTRGPAPKDAPKADGRGPAPREVAPMPKEKGADRGSAPKDAGPMGGRGFGPPFGPGGPMGRGFGGPGGPKGPPFGPGGGVPPFAQNRGTPPMPGSPGVAPGDFEGRLNRIIDELERLRDDLHRQPKR